MKLNHKQITYQIEIRNIWIQYILNNFYSETNGRRSQGYQLNPCTRYTSNNSDEKRKRTDIFCTVCTGIFAGIIFIIAIACFNAGIKSLYQGNLGKMTYPADGEGNLCGWDAP